MVWVDEAHLPVLHRMLDEIRANVAQALPSLGDEALLATLADEILGRPQVSHEETQDVTIVPGLAHGR